MDVGNPRVEERIESLDESVELNLQLVRADRGSMNRRVQGWRIASGGKDSNASHGSLPLCRSLT
jgi:hypothetical protein